MSACSGVGWTHIRHAERKGSPSSDGSRPSFAADRCSARLISRRSTLHAPRSTHRATSYVPGQSTPTRRTLFSVACWSFTSSISARISHDRRTAPMRAGACLPVSAETARAPLMGMIGASGSARLNRAGSVTSAGTTVLPVSSGTYSASNTFVSNSRRTKPRIATSTLPFSMGITVFILNLASHRPRLPHRIRAEFLESGHHFGHRHGKALPLARADPAQPHAPLVEPCRFQNLVQRHVPAAGLVIAGLIMTVARMAAANEHAVRAFDQRLERVHRVHRAAAHQPHAAHVRRILQPRRAGQVCTRVRAPVAEKRDDTGFEVFVVHAASYPDKVTW